MHIIFIVGKKDAMENGCRLFNTCIIIVQGFLPGTFSLSDHYTMIIRRSAALILLPGEYIIYIYNKYICPIYLT